MTALEDFLREAHHLHKGGLAAYEEPAPIMLNHASSEAMEWAAKHYRYGGAHMWEQHTRHQLTDHIGNWTDPISWALRQDNELAHLTRPRATGNSWMVDVRVEAGCLVPPVHRVMGGLSAPGGLLPRLRRQQLGLPDGPTTPPPRPTDPPKPPTGDEVVPDGYRCYAPLPGSTYDSELTLIFQAGEYKGEELEITVVPINCMGGRPVNEEQWETLSVEPHGRAQVTMRAPAPAHRILDIRSTAPITGQWLLKHESGALIAQGDLLTDADFTGCYTAKVPLNHGGEGEQRTWVIVMQHPDDAVLEPTFAVQRPVRILDEEGFQLPGVPQAALRTASDTRSTGLMSIWDPVERWGVLPHPFGSEYPDSLFGSFVFQGEGDDRGPGHPQPGSERWCVIACIRSRDLSATHVARGEALGWRS